MTTLPFDSTCAWYWNMLTALVAMSFQPENCEMNSGMGCVCPVMPLIAASKSRCHSRSPSL